MKKIIFCSIAILFSCTPRKGVEVTVLSSFNNQPLEGAILYAKAYRKAFRSDVNGKIFVSKNLVLSSFTLDAKNHRQLVYEKLSSGAITMQFDSALVNPIEAKLRFGRADTLRGTYGEFRSNNDIRHYDLSMDLDIDRKFLSGVNKIRFTALRDLKTIQIDLFDNMLVDSITFGAAKLAFRREFNAVFVDFPAPIETGKTATIDFYYSGNPIETGRFGGIAFKEDSLGNPWIYTACQGTGASLFWPNKDQQPDEVDSMNIKITVPSDLVAVSNGELVRESAVAPNKTQYFWRVNNPINNYSVSLNIGKYMHFSEEANGETYNFYVMPYHQNGAKRQFAQVPKMMEAFEKYFGKYPFPEDGFKLIEVPYSGMEHQSAVTYGNQFRNGYLGRDWTGVGVSLKFDFIIIHESGHEWFGNSVTANDVSDAWIQEGFCTYAEMVYVEHVFGYKDAIKYVNGYKEKVRNLQPIIGPTGLNQWPTQDMYFKGALFLHTLRSIVDDDQKWWKTIKSYAKEFKHENIWTTDVLNFFSEKLDADLKPVFDQYLYHSAIPTFQYAIENGVLRYRWKADVANFAMAIKIAIDGQEKWIYPTTAWQEETISASEISVRDDLVYVDIEEI